MEEHCKPPKIKYLLRPLYTSQPQEKTIAQEKTYKGLTYNDAGVNIDAGNALVEAIKPLAQKTSRTGADATLGGFGGLFDLVSNIKFPFGASSFSQLRGARLPDQPYFLAPLPSRSPF